MKYAAASPARKQRSTITEVGANGHRKGGFHSVRSTKINSTAVERPVSPWLLRVDGAVDENRM
jgi:hypothetical protein